MERFSIESLTKFHLHAYMAVFSIKPFACISAARSSKSSELPLLAAVCSGTSQTKAPESLAGELCFHVHGD